MPLDLGPYLLGVAQLPAIAGFAWLGAASLRRRLVPELSGPPAGLAEGVLALGLLVVSAEMLGSFGLFEPLPHLVAVALVGLALRRSLPGPPLRLPVRPLGVELVPVMAMLLALLLVIGVAGEVRLRLDTGMTGFDTTWYHAPFAAGFFQSGDTWGLHHIAPQFLAWFYPANGEVFHAIGMNAFGRDLASPLLNLGWLLACLFAAWCIGRPFGLGLTAAFAAYLILAKPVFADQMGEARNDVVGVFFLLSAAALAIAASVGEDGGRRPLSGGALALVGLAAGLAAGTKLNFLLPCVVLVAGLAAVAPGRARPRALGLGLAGALVGGGYWYLRNLVHAGNPLPWFDSLGPISLPAPDQELGGREAHSVLGYLTDAGVWSDWFGPGLHDGFGALWPLMLALGLAGLLIGLGPRSTPVLRVAALTGLATVLAWLVAPTSASGPEGSPAGFESGLRYLVGGLALGAALLAAMPPLRGFLLPEREWNRRWQPPLPPWSGALACLLIAALAIGAGHVVQRDYLRDRYANPTFTAPGLNAAFAWATPLSDARIATTSTRQYPLFGGDLSNRVEFVGEERPHGGFVAPTTCRAWRRLLNAGDYDFVVATRDRIEPGRPPFPESARWTEGPRAKIVLRKPPTVVFELSGRLDPSSCRS
jgi:hypothetical protein